LNSHKVRPKRFNLTLKNTKLQEKNRELKERRSPLKLLEKPKKQLLPTIMLPKKLELKSLRLFEEERVHRFIFLHIDVYVYIIYYYYLKGGNENKGNGDYINDSLKRINESFVS